MKKLIFLSSILLMISLTGFLVADYMTASARSGVNDVTAAVETSGGGAVSPVRGASSPADAVAVPVVPADGFQFNYWRNDTTGTSNQVNSITDSDGPPILYLQTPLTGDILFQDTFDDNRNQWKLGDDLYIENGVLNALIQKPEPEEEWLRTLYQWPVVSHGLTNFDYEAEVTTVKCEDKFARGIAFLCNRDAEGTTRVYNFVISGYGKYSLQLWTRGMDTVYVIPWTESKYINTGTATNRLKVISRDSNIELYVNDQLLNIISGQFPADIGENGIGLDLCGNSGTHITFDNMQMWRPY